MINQQQNIVASLCETPACGRHLLSFIDRERQNIVEGKRNKYIIGETRKANLLRGYGGLERGLLTWEGQRRIRVKSVAKHLS